jgi:MYXO-CTERM domain-containing protein
MLAALLALQLALTPAAAVTVTAHAPVAHLEAGLQHQAPAMYAELNRALGADPLDEVHIDLTATLRDAEQDLHWRLPSWAAGAARSEEGEILLTVHKDGQRHDIERVLRHELAHVAIASAAGGAEVPRWFNEGLARYLAREQSASDAQQLAGARLAGRLPSLEGLTRSFPPGADDASLAYATSARAIELVVARGGEQAPARVLHALARGEDFDDALKAATGLPTWQLSLRVRDAIALWPAMLTVLKDAGGPLAFAGLLAIVGYGRLRRRRREQLDALGARDDLESRWTGIVAWRVRPWIAHQTIKA